MQETCTSKMVTLFEQMFNPQACYQLARKHQFIQRSSSKIHGHELIKTLILPSQGLSEDSLNGLCYRLREFNPDLDISASALAQRINKQSAVLLIKACFGKILDLTRNQLEKQYPYVKGILSFFKNIYGEDSTVFEVSKFLQKQFPGTKRGGREGKLSCKAQMKIDLIHNFTRGVIEHAAIYEGKRPDQSLTEKIFEVACKGDLILRDLGYFKLKSFKKLSEIGGYFITRLPSHIKIYLNFEDKVPLDLPRYLDKHYKYSSEIDLKVLVGDERLPVRLIAYRVPKDVLNERLRKANKGAKEMGRVLSRSKLDRMKFSIFITNIPEEWVSAEFIGTVYRLRWEMELIFKHWKHLLHIDILEGISIYRTEVLIWSRLCTTVLVAYVSAIFMNLANSYCQGELSPVKLIEYLMRNGKLCEAVKLNRIEEFEQEMLLDLGRRLMKNRRSRKTMRERIIDLEPYYELGNCS